MYIYHPRGVFLAGFGWFQGKILCFNIQIRVYQILFTDRTTDNVAAENFDGIDLIFLKSFFSVLAFCSFIAHLCVKFQLI